MKYLILVIVSLFCLTSFSDHKKDPVSEEERNRYYELYDKISKYDFFRSYKPSTDEEWEIYNSLKKPTEEEIEDYRFLNKIINQEQEIIKEHFNTYMWLEYILLNAEKGDELAQEYAYTLFQQQSSEGSIESMESICNNQMCSSAFFLYDLPNCTKERLEKGECPKPPYFTMYWMKKVFYNGDCPYKEAPALLSVMRNVFLKTDIRDHESLFYILNYVAAFIYHKAEGYRLYFEQFTGFKETKEEELKKGKITEEEFEKQTEELRQGYEWLLSIVEKEVEEAREKLSKKDQKIADQKINDLIQKWSEKYGKDQIYACTKKEKSSHQNFNSIKSQKAFLDKYYPHLD